MIPVAAAGLSAADHYSRLDRMLHYVAFAALPAQCALADVEDRLWAVRVSPDAARRPVFVASLPRAGTTVLLQALAALPDFACHTFRDMPFVLCPMLWDRLTRALRRPGRSRPRAHGDGLAIDYDSAEAFEEVLWKAFWPVKYQRDRIVPWSPDDRKPEFEDFLRRHMLKVIALRSDEHRDGPSRRYLSKNNASVARLGLLPALFPECRIIVVVRRPEDQVRSLHRQHVRFSRMHAVDAFSRRYMRWLGHFEFGLDLHPVNFADWLSKPPVATPDSEAFWLQYWVTSYEAVLQAAGGNVIFFDHDRACREPRASLDALANALSLHPASDLPGEAGRYRSAALPPDPLQADPASINKAQALHQRLRARCLLP